MMDQIKTVGVVGAGTMGIGIAEVAAAHGQTVRLFDVNVEFARAAVEKLSARTEKRVSKGKITAEDASAMLGRIGVVETLSEFSDCDLVVEAIIENLDIKRQLFQDLERICSSDCLLSSNTSSISITAIANGMQDASRLFGLHFFNPAPVMKLVEVISGLLTDPKVMDIGMKLCDFWGKIAIRANSSPGFVVNRVARSFYGEPLKMKQEQLADVTVIDAVMKQATGFRMGPFELMDLIGIDVNFSVSQSVYQAMFNDPRFKPSLLQGEMVNAGTLGRKSGRGFYQYPGNSDDHLSFETVNDPDAYYDVIGDWSFDSMLNDSAGLYIGGCRVCVTNGLTAQQMAQDSGTAVCLVDWSFDWEKASLVNLACSVDVTSVQKQALVHWFTRKGKAVVFCADQPGMIAARTLAMLINEAADAVFNGVCSEQDVDLAMRYGVNYPKGLMAFGEQMGWAVVASVLENLQQWFGDDRYRLSPLIRNKQ